MAEGPRKRAFFSWQCRNHRGRAGRTCGERRAKSSVLPRRQPENVEWQVCECRGQPAPGTINASNYAEFLRSNRVDVVGTELEVVGPLRVRRCDIGTRNPVGSIFGIEIESGGAKPDSY